jgi:hypothetical protein
MNKNCKTCCWNEQPIENFPCRACNKLSYYESMDELHKMLNQLTKIANEKYDGHYTLMKFTTNYRVCFGTIDNIEKIKYMAEGKTLDEAIINATNGNVDDYYLFLQK